MMMMKTTLGRAWRKNGGSKEVIYVHLTIVRIMSVYAL